jgi:hypothetical protein
VRPETVATVHRASARGFERHGRHRAAFSARDFIRFALGAAKTAPPATATTAAAGATAAATAALRLALLAALAAPLRLVGEAALRIPLLIRGGVNKLSTAISAHNHLVFE